jgi:hypothetical protein
LHAQHHHSPLPGGEFFEGTPERVATLLGADLRRGSRERRPRLGGNAESLQERTPALVSNSLQPNVRGDPVDPSPQPGVTSKARQPPVHTEEDLLSGVLGLRGADLAGEDPKHDGGVFADDLGEGVFVSTPRARNDTLCTADIIGFL